MWPPVKMSQTIRAIGYWHNRSPLAPHFLKIKTLKKPLEISCIMAIDQECGNKTPGLDNNNSVCHIKHHVFHLQF